MESVGGDYEFSSNYLVGAKKRPEVTEEFFVDDVACYEQYNPIAYGTEHGVVVKDNLAQGSEGEGFVFPSTPCKYLDSYPFHNNTAGSCQIAFMFARVVGQ